VHIPIGYFVEATDNDADGPTAEQTANKQATTWILPTPVRRVPERVTATWVTQTAADHASLR